MNAITLFIRLGAFYKKHLDAFKGTNSRILSTVLYLNPGWLAGDGGELVLYHPVSDEVLEVVTPDFGKMVIFLSEEFPHEVLPAQTRALLSHGLVSKKQLTCAVY